MAHCYAEDDTEILYNIENHGSTRRHNPIGEYTCYKMFASGFTSPVPTCIMWQDFMNSLIFYKKLQKNIPWLAANLDFHTLPFKVLQKKILCKCSLVGKIPQHFLPQKNSTTSCLQLDM